MKDRKPMLRKPQTAAPEDTKLIGGKVNKSRQREKITDYKKLFKSVK